MEGRCDADVRTSQAWGGGDPCGWGEQGRAREEYRSSQTVLKLWGPAIRRSLRVVGSLLVSRNVMSFSSSLPPSLNAADRFYVSV